MGEDCSNVKHILEARKHVLQQFHLNKKLGHKCNACVRKKITSLNETEKKMREERTNLQWRKMLPWTQMVAKKTQTLPTMKPRKTQTQERKCKKNERNHSLVQRLTAENGAPLELLCTTKWHIDMSKGANPAHTGWLTTSRVENE